MMAQRNSSSNLSQDDPLLSPTLDRGPKFQDILELEAYLKERAVLEPKEGVGPFVVQAVPGPHKAYVILTQEGNNLQQLVLVKTFVDRDPMIRQFQRPQRLHLAAQDGTTLMVQGQRAYEVGQLPPGAAQRILELVRWGRFGAAPMKNRTAASPSGRNARAKTPHGITPTSVQIRPLSSLALARRLLADLHVTPGCRPDQYRLVAQSNGHRLILRDSAYWFDRQEAALQFPTTQGRRTRDRSSRSPPPAGGSARGAAHAPATAEPGPQSSR